ncbi:2OG-Fe(II) oxygenase family protein [Oecophyllibacter saccharovorans]|uniref:2OG-Fe(II) oxygenase family protein n=1 Tax=Oecophyllibacter saccharovorans TaxID=2558360 RepID=UPI001E51E8C5|nr:2OG-Fe(II) oxygenase [Oecophyllibacter saccharovorans]
MTPRQSEAGSRPAHPHPAKAGGDTAFPRDRAAADRVFEHAFDYDAVLRALVMDIPCPYLVVENFVPPRVLAHVLALWPEIPSGGSFPRSALEVPPALAGFLEEFEGPKLKKLIGRKFGLDLEAAPSMVTLRGQTRARDGRIHLDSPSKWVTLLLYLNPREQAWPDHAGCLRFLNGPHDMEDYEAEIPPYGGTLVAFPNHPASWHGHREYVGPRRSVQLNYMHRPQKVASEKLRHHVSAFFKKHFLSS